MEVGAFRVSPAACIVAAACLWLLSVPSSGLAAAQVSGTSRVSRTSVMVACQRAITARDPNPDTRNPDYLAEELLDPELMTLVPACADLQRPFEDVWAEYVKRGVRGFFAVVARTRHIDRSLQASLAEGVRQVVILGAGLDSRAYRMGPDHSGVRFFEVDLPATQEDKKQRVVRVLGSLPRNVVYVPVDFERESLRTRLSEAGFREDAPAFFVWEGVSMYLTAEAVDATLDYIARGTASDSSIIFDYVPAGVIDGTSTEPPAVRARRLEMLKRFGEPWLFGVPDGGIGDLVGKHGLELVSNLTIRELWNRYLRPGTADAVLGDADPEGGVALARVPARQVADRVVTATARPPRPAEARVAPVDEPWTAEQRDYLEPHQRAGRLFNVFKTAAHHP